MALFYAAIWRVSISLLKFPGFLLWDGVRKSFKVAIELFLPIFVS